MFTGLERLDPARRLNCLVDFKVTPGFDSNFIKCVREADPILIFNHQAHADGISAAIAVDHLLDLTRRSGRESEIKVFVLPIARSIQGGQQGVILQALFNPFSALMVRRGLHTLPITRDVDQVRYGMRKDNTESDNIRKFLEAGNRLVLFPERTVQAGRCPTGGDPEKIYGMQEVSDKVLINACLLTKSVNGGNPIFLVLGSLHGGYRIQSPNKERLFGSVVRSLLYFAGVPVSFTKAEATLGTIITEDFLAGKLGTDWINGNHRNDQAWLTGFNDLIMGEVAELVPDSAKGAYSRTEKCV